jgi:hypothetical protein
MATYFHKLSGVTYNLQGVKSLAQAWALSKTVCEINNWNHDMFCEDVVVRFTK